MTEAQPQRLEELRSRMSERLTAELERAQLEVRKALARVRGDEEEDYLERQFDGLTQAQLAGIEREKQEVAALERKARSEPQGAQRRRNPMWTWNRRQRGGP